MTEVCPDAERGAGAPAHKQGVWSGETPGRTLGGNNGTALLITAEEIQMCGDQSGRMMIQMLQESHF